jgi:hypothetical protein
MEFAVDPAVSITESYGSKDHGGQWLHGADAQQK